MEDLQRPQAEDDSVEGLSELEIKQKLEEDWQVVRKEALVKLNERILEIFTRARDGLNSQGENYKEMKEQMKREMEALLAE